MKIVQNLNRFFRDSPTYGRDRSNLITGGTIGITSLLLNGAILFLMSTFLFNSDEPWLRQLCDDLGFGQMMALILLGGISAFATVIVPLRLATVFYEPRVGRYFDQIVLSGISPMRFLIGKVTSQNLYLILILILLLPYLALSIMLGGVNFSFFLAGLGLVWLYCLSLALATLWVSLYFNEGLAALFVIGMAGFICLMGCMPIPYQPFVLSPFPVLFQPIYASVRNSMLPVPLGLETLYMLCAGGMLTFIICAVFAIEFGPLYGIVRENSTFGEVVRAGDSKRKQKTQFRLHIQRSTEIAFFYQNRGAWFRRHEGLLRWGVGLVVLMGLFATAEFFFADVFRRYVWNWKYYSASNFFGPLFFIDACGLVLATLLFSHAKNSTYLDVPLGRGFSAKVSQLDTFSFVVFLIFSTAVTLVTPVCFEYWVALPANETLFKLSPSNQTVNPVDPVRIYGEGTLIITLSGIFIYALQRRFCLMAWSKLSAAFNVWAVYSLGFFVMPFLASTAIREFWNLHRSPLLASLTPYVAAISPSAVLQMLFEGGYMYHTFPTQISSVPFYVVHGVLFPVVLWSIHHAGRKVRPFYLQAPTGETPHA